MTRFLHEFRIGSDKEQRDADLGRILSEHALAPFTERDVTTTDASNQSCFGGHAASRDTFLRDTFLH